MRVLGVETSCDETACAVVEDGKNILSNVVLSQVRLHGPFSGVVPEIACRAHVHWLVRIMDEALKHAGVKKDEIDAVAVVNRPGLIGALLAGLAGAKALALALGKPLVAVDHLQAHIYAAVMSHPGLGFPFLAMVLSGGHTAIYRAKAPGESELLGKSLRELELPRRVGLHVAAIRRSSGETIYRPDSGVAFEEGDTVVVFGQSGAAAALQQLHL